MALQGTLDTFSLPDVLRLLATTSKTGRLRIDGDRGQGSVWLSDGGVVDADAERAVDGTPTEEVVFELLRFRSGAFAFDGDDTPNAGGEPEDVESLLRRANALLSEWSELESVVPSLAHEVTLASDLSVDEVTIDAERWRSLVAVASGRTIGELAKALGLTELGVSRAVRDLVDLGVAEVESPGSAPRPPVSDRDLPQGRPAARPDHETPAPVGRNGPLTGESSRAGWLTGEVPAVHDPRSASVNDPRSAPANGPARASLDDTVATPPPAPSEPPAKGGLTSRLGRGRSASASARNGTSRSAGPPTTGSTPPVTGSTRSVGQPPSAPPPARTNDSGAGPLGGPRATGPTARRDTGTTRPVPSDRPGARTPRPRAEGPTRPPSAPAGPGAPTGPGRTGSRPGPSPYDSGRLGPSPASRDTGQIRPITPSSLPPDLHWAADDTNGGSTNGGPPTSPFSGLSSLGPSRPAPNDNELASHVAAMSPEARAAVQATVGNQGGTSGGRGPSQGEEIAHRGRLISFLASVR